EHSRVLPALLDVPSGAAPKRRPPLLNPVVGCRTARPCSERCYRHSGSRRIRLEIVELGGHRVGHIKRKLSGHVSGRNSIWWSAPHRSRSKSTERRACGTGATLIATSSSDWKHIAS